MKKSIFIISICLLSFGLFSQSSQATETLTKETALKIETKKSEQENFYKNKMKQIEAMEKEYISKSNQELKTNIELEKRNLEILRKKDHIEIMKMHYDANPSQSLMNEMNYEKNLLKSLKENKNNN